MELSLPETFEAYSDARKAGFLKVKTAKEGGRRVAGTFCTFTPLEILDAAGMLAVSLCGMSAETIPTAEVDLPRNLCPLIKSSYGFYVSDKCPYTYFSDLIVGETTCDGKKKMYELMVRGKELFLLHLPQGVILAVIQRGGDTIIPRGDVALKAGDRLVIGAEHLKGDRPVNLREITLRKNHDWNGVAIKDIDISRQSFIVMVRRGKKLIVPYGKLVLAEGDTVILYSKEAPRPTITF